MGMQIQAVRAGGGASQSQQHASVHAAEVAEACAN